VYHTHICKVVYRGSELFGKQNGQQSEADKEYGHNHGCGGIATTGNCDFHTSEM
jgi:hypothetical protein